MKKSCVVLIPIYKENLDTDEFFSVTASLVHLKDFDVVFIGPKNLKLAYYSKEFPEISFLGFENDFFSSINGYNKLLTSEYFYQIFDGYNYMLILQSDAILLKNELAKWIAKDYDYIGAPWPKGYSLTINTNKLPVEGGVLCTTFIGNGGLSLRKIRSCIQLLREFPDLALDWQNTGHAEDLYFGFLSTVSDFFKTPNIKIAAEFSHDIDPQYLSKLINNQTPFGVHAWSKYDRSFWTNHPNWPK
jgi:Protein of unknown function (DUF5672)